MSRLMPVTPFPLTPSPPGRRLDVSCKIESPYGWFELNDHVRYTLEASSFSETGTTYRREEVTSKFVEGTFVISAVRENVQESLAVYVLGDDEQHHAELLHRLTEALGQISYRVMMRRGNLAKYWTCSPADYRISAPRELQHARRCLVNATLVRHPQEDFVKATGDEV